MPARLLLAMRYIALVILILAVVLILVRWRFPRSAPDGTQSTFSYIRELWRRWRERKALQIEKGRDLRALRGRAALVVDPDEKSRRVLTWRLEALGCKAIGARTGTQGLVRARDASFDFVVADALMPDISPVEFHSSLHTPGKPVVFVGVRDNQWRDLRALGSRVACLGEPFDPDDVAALAGRLIRRTDREPSEV